MTNQERYNGWSSISYTYRDTEFVLNEIKNIIKQLKEKQHENF